MSEHSTSQCSLQINVTRIPVHSVCSFHLKKSWNLGYSAVLVKQILIQLKFIAFQYYPEESHMLLKIEGDNLFYKFLLKMMTPQISEFDK